MILNDTDIENLAKSKSLITPYNPKNLRRASYDLSVGVEFCVFDGKDIRRANNTMIQSHTLASGQSFEIPPNSVCFISCSEQILLPNDTCARVSLRMSYIYRGIVVTSQPPFDPGYEGMVVVMIHNLSNQPIPLKEGERFVTIEFFRTTGPYAKTTTPTKNVVNFQEPLKGRIVTSLQGLESNVRRIKKLVNRLRNQLITLVTAIIAVPAIFVYFTYSSLSNKIDDQQKEIEKLRIALDVHKSNRPAIVNPPTLQFSSTSPMMDNKIKDKSVSK